MLENLKPLLSVKMNKPAVDITMEKHNSVETAFHIQGNRNLRINTLGWSRQASVFFSSNTARTPENLVNHVQRILYHISDRNAEQLYGALLDLFLILGIRGVDLRKRMLSYSSSVLTAQQIAQLTELIENRRKSDETYPVHRYSILSPGYTRIYRLLEKIEPFSKAAMQEV